MERLLIACADIGSVAKGNFGWCDSDSSEGHTPTELATKVAAALADYRPVALGFECPLFVPLPEAEGELGKSREGEGSRAWSAAAGCGALATGLVQVTWVLREVRKLCSSECRAFLAWDDFKAAGCGLLVWEAFVSGSAKGPSHVADARRAIEALARSLPSPKSDITAASPMSLAGFALLHAGWPVGVKALSQPCLAVKA